MSDVRLTQHSRRAHARLSECAVRPHPLKRKWSMEGELEVDFKIVVVTSGSGRPLADARVPDELVL